MNVSDNGKGLPPNRGDPGGNGLINIRQRLQRLGGSVEWSAVPEGGTRVTFRIPIRTLTDGLA